MQCPVCTTERLTMAERQGIEIDYCPKCRGVWLDRGELDKLIEKATAAVEAAPAPAPAPVQAAPAPQQQPYGQPPYRGPEPPRHHDDRFGHRGDDDYRPPYPQQGYGYGKPYKKRKGLLGEIFDFD